MTTAVTGARALLRATLRHDGRSIAPWIAIVTVLSASSVLVYPWIFPHAADRTALATAIGANPALGMIFGPAFDLSTSEGFNAWRSLSLGGFVTALGAIFAVVRATRGQEDSGQAELLASGVMGRASRLLAALGLAGVGSLAVGVVSGAVTVACGGAWEDSLLLAATFTATGWMCTGIAAIAAQCGSDARTATSLAVGTLGVLFLLRGFAFSVDAPAWTIWANPLGWMTQTRPASGNHWWPLLLAVACAVATMAVAFVLQARRDFGQGAIAPRPGPARGAVHGPWSLAVRLNRGPMVTWAMAFAVLGTVSGYFATSIQDILSKDSAVAAILAAGATTPEELAAAFLVTILCLVGIIAAVPGVQILLKVRVEEMEDRVEPLVATAVSRRRYFLSHMALALLMPAAYVLLAGVLVSLLAGTAGIGVGVGHTLLQAVVTIPAVWTTTAVAVAVVGARPRVAIAAWVGVVAAFGLTLLGPTFRLWDWVLAISPFWHVPAVTQATPGWMGMVWVSLVTLVLAGVGIAGFSRRDLAVS